MRFDKISYNGVEIDLGKPFARMTMIDAIKKYAGVDFDQVPDDAAAKKLADEHHISTRSATRRVTS